MRRRAIVLGGGMGGLLTARALARSFDVTVVERDPLEVDAGARKGIPQARHAHILLGRGREVIEGLFPGIGGELLARGAVPVEIGRTVGYLTPFGWSPPFAPGVELVGCSRDLLEATTRARVRADVAIEVLDGHDVIDLVGDRRRIRGVRIAARNGAGTGERTLEADLVVDATGRGSPLPRWLDALGVKVPADTVVDAKAVYASAVIERPALPCGWNVLFVLAAPPGVLRGGALFPIEGGLSLMTLIGMGGEVPPTSEAEWRTFVRTPRSKLLDDVLGSAKLVGPIVGSRTTSNRSRPYHRAALPDGLVAIADSVTAFNPIYGQGMTVAALQAVALAEEAERGAGLEHRAQNRIARIGQEGFRMAVGADRRVPGVTGKLPIAERAFNRYVDAVFAACTDSPSMSRSVTRVMHMLDPATTLFAPKHLQRALPQALRGAPPERSPEHSAEWRAIDASIPKTSDMAPSTAATAATTAATP
jgi:2-polyprenyl-6-methoxyphenol hydroxylase-like FAD-dependent oxidoreductase